MEAELPLARFRRVFRPLNLILIHQGLWALLLLGADGPRITDPGRLPWDWWAIRTGCAALAIAIALLYLRRMSPMQHPLSRILPGDRPSSPRMQAGFAVLGLALMLTVARLLTESPPEMALKIVAFGAIDALAYQLIAFGIAFSLYDAAGWGLGAVIGSFALSWGLRDLILNIIGDNQSALLFALVGGAITGALIGLVSIGLRKWPGGFWIAWAAQFIVITLIAGFA
ncbi:MAG: hypothetical protein IT334_04620 [Thermomicrobiales bacterium]|nr:hypothetical protein [Thermomicrobiales bacterium]